MTSESDRNSQKAEINDTLTHILTNNPQLQKKKQKCNSAAF